MATGGEEPEKWRAKFLLRLPLRTVPNMIDRADRQVYKSLSQFHMDSLTIVHNITIFYGGNYDNFYCCSYFKFNFLLIMTELTLL